MNFKRQMQAVRYGESNGAMTHYLTPLNSQPLSPILLWDHYKERHVLTPTGLDFHGHSGIVSLTYPILGHVHHINGYHCQQKLHQEEYWLKTGDVLTLNAGCGVIHKDQLMPYQGEVECLSMWCALPPQEEEMSSPKSQHFTQTELPVIETPNTRTKVLVGQFHDRQSPIQWPQNLTLLDIHIQPYQHWQHPEQWKTTTGFLYVISGIVYVQGRQVHAQQMALLTATNEGLDIQTGQDHSRFFVALIPPNNPPVIRTEHSAHSTLKNLTQSENDIAQLLTDLQCQRLSS